MNVKLNETRLWYCEICDRTINIESKSQPFISKTHVNRKEHGIVVRKYEIIKPKLDEIV